MFENIYFFKTMNDLQCSLESGSYLLLVAEKTNLSNIFSESSLTLVGAIFPYVIFGTQSFDEGIIAAKLGDDTYMHIVYDMGDTKALEVSQDTRSVFAIVDGLSSRVDDFLDELYSSLPEKAKIIGGGAGKLTLKQEPTLFDYSGFYQDGAIVMYCKEKMGIGIEHGWEPIVSHLMATTCSGHHLHKINFKDAFLVYKEIVEADGHRSFDKESFFDIAKSYPIGIVRYNKDFIVRNPVATDGNSLVIVGNIDQYSVLAILKGEKKKLIAAAHKAAMTSLEHAGKKQKSTLLIDCVSRFLFLEKDFTVELEAVSSAFSHGTIQWGMLSLGEIANANQEGIEFYNKTCVVGTL